MFVDFSNFQVSTFGFTFISNTIVADSTIEQAEEGIISDVSCSSVSLE